MGEGAHEKTLYPFQSTLLMRGATSMRSIRPEPNLYFNPRSSCEERRQHLRRDVECRAISIHAPHARSDQS